MKKKREKLKMDAGENQYLKRRKRERSLQGNCEQMERQVQEVEEGSASKANVG